MINMPRNFMTLDDFDLDNKTVLIRLDMNSPIDHETGEITDDTRIKSYKGTLEALRDSKVVIIAHQSRPGKKDFSSLKPHAKRLSKIIGRDVTFAGTLYGDVTADKVKAMKKGDILLLENVRMYSEEIVLKEPAFFYNTIMVKNLSKVVDVYMSFRV